MLYYKANSNRKAAFQTYISILKNNIVCKGALNQSAQEHVLSIYQNAMKLAEISDHFNLNYRFENNKVYCDLVEGISFSEILVGYLKNKEYDLLIQKIKEFFIQLDQILPNCSYQSQESILNIQEHEDLTYTNIANLDFNFDNIFICENDYKVIDCEWCFDWIVPKEYIKFRSLLYFYSKYSPLFKGYMTYEKWMELFQVKYVEEFMHYEDLFQAYVYGTNRENNFIASWFEENRKLRLQKLSEPFFQVYYDDGTGYSEAHSMIKSVTNKHHQFTIEFNQHLNGLRIDVLNSECVVKINQLSYQRRNKTVKPDLNTLVSNGYAFENQIAYLNDDPQLYLFNINHYVVSLSIDYEIIDYKYEPDYIQHVNEIMNHIQNSNNTKIQELQVALNHANGLIDELRHPLKRVAKKIRG